LSGFFYGWNMAADTRVSITVDTGNAEGSLSRLGQALAQAGRAADQASDNIDNVADSANSATRDASRLGKALDGIKTIGAAAGIALGAVGLGLKGAVDEAIKFESAMADVKKVVNFDSPQGLANMRQDLLDLSTQIPITADGLAQIAAAAGQSGIAANEITKFTEAAAKMGTAFDISAQEAGQAMAEMRTAFKMSQTDVEALADKINYLGNTSPNSAAKIMKIVQTVGPLGELAGVSAAQIAAMGASVNSLAPEVVATGLKNMFLALTKGESATKSASEAFKKLGLDSVQVSKDMQTNSEATINRIIESLKKLPEAQRTATINDIFGAEALPVIAQMVTNTETLTKNLTAVGDATKYAGSMQQEYAARSATTENQLALFSNNLNVLKVNVGSALLPAINQLAQAVIPVVQSMATWAQQNPDLVTQIVAITGAVLGAITVLGGLALAFTAVSSGIAAISAIGAGIGAIVTFFTSGAAAVSLLTGAFSAFVTVLGVITAPVTAVVAGIAALAAAAVYLYRNWDMVKAKTIEVFNTLPQPIQQAVANIKSIFTGLFSFLQPVFQTGFAVMSQVASAQFSLLKGIVTTAWAAIKGVFTTSLSVIKSVVVAGLTVLASVFNAQFGIIKTVVSTVMNAIKALVQGDIQGVKNAFSSGFAAVVGIVKTAVSNIVSAFSNLGSQLFTIGVQAVQGLANGIKSRIASVGAEARNLASNVANSIRSVLDIHSPSRVTHALGEHAGQGLANGLKAKQSEVAKAAQATADTVKSTIGDLLKQRFMIGNDDPLADLQWRLQNGDLSGANSADKQKILELAKANQELVVIDKERVALANQLKQAQDGVDSSIADMNRQIALFGNDNPLSAFLYDMQNTDKYVGATAEKLQMMASKIQQLETLKQTKASEDAFSKLGTDLAQESPMAKLTAEYEQRLAIVDQYEQLHTDKVVEAEAMRKQVKDSYTQASNSLMLSQYEGLFSGVAGITKAAFGEQSKAYRAMFAVQKAFSIAQSVMAIQTSVAKAMAVGFPANIPLIGQAISQGAGILSTLRGVQSPAIGQAHDGIMSVPKSGTWNLEKGERVLPKHTAAAMDKTLANANSGGVQVNNYAGVAVTAKQENGLTIIDVRNEIERKMRSDMTNPNSVIGKSIYRNTTANPQR
jgi:TP901 family phage tail tape measure protein